MNPKQRRGVILMIIAAFGAVAVFLGIITYVQSVSSEVGPRTTVYMAARDIAKFAPISEDVVEATDIPTKYVTPQMITNKEQLAGQKANTPIKSGSWLQSDMLAPASSIEDGEREISVNFEGDLGINGRVAPGDTVDVIAAFARARENDQGENAYKRAEIPYNVAGVLVRNARVVSVGAPSDPNAQVGAADQSGAGVSVVPVTFAVSVEDAGRLAYGEAFAVSMRLMRSGNNETGSRIAEEDLSFDDPGLQEVLGG
ncbi:pilus assembly protein CpaB [Brevibacterium pityocampae]